MNMFTKPANMTYTQMAMYFDAHFYENPENRDDTKFYTYVYLLCQMIAGKGHYFTKQEYYDEFSQYLASALYMRLLQKERNGDPPVKSILNYIKASAYPMKVAYQNEAFYQVDNPNYEGRPDAELALERMTNSIKKDYSIGVESDISDELAHAAKAISDEIAQSPYANDKYMAYCLTMSLKLSFLSSITLSSNIRHRINSRKIQEEMRIQLFSAAYKKESCKSIVLWRLSDIYSDYVMLLMRKVKRRVAKEIGEIKVAHTLSDDAVNDILMTAYSTYNDYRGD